MRHLALAASLLLVVGSLSAHAEAEPGGQFNVGLSPKVAKDLKDASSSDITPERVREILGELRTNYELGVGALDLHSPYALKGRKEWPWRFSFALQAEGAGFVSVPNPTANVVRAAGAGAGILKASLEGNLAEDLYFESAFNFGAGLERQYEFTDLGTSIGRTERRSTLLLGGIDFKFQKVFRFEDWRWVSNLGTEETYFYPLNTSTDGMLNWDLEKLSHDWFFRNDVLFSRFNLHVIAAKHPYPSHILPRTWNRITATPQYDRIRSYGGGGAGVNFRLADDILLAFLGGYYAGGPGGELRFRVDKKFDLHLLSYEIENSNDFQSLRQRIYGLTFDVAL